MPFPKDLTEKASRSLTALGVTVTFSARQTLRRDFLFRQSPHTRDWHSDGLGSAARGCPARAGRRNSACAGLGTAAGIGGGLALTRFLQSLLFEIKPTDPFIVVAMEAIVAGRRATSPGCRAIRVR